MSNVTTLYEDILVVSCNNCGGEKWQFEVIKILGDENFKVRVVCTNCDSYREAQLIGCQTK